MRPAALAILAFASLWLSAPVLAHETRPALIKLEQRADGRFDITWKQPEAGGFGPQLDPRITGGLIDRAPDVHYATAAFELQQWRAVSAPGGLEGRALSVEGLDRTITDVFVSIRTSEGEVRQHVLQPGEGAVPLAAGQSGATAPAYLLLGVEHILTGYDHLAFLLALMLLVASRWMLFKTITAFTLAHSVTLALTAMGLVTFRPALIEALVALSIVFVAVELVQLNRGRRSLLARWPWLIALGFGLLHGCAFAGALAEIGLPRDETLPAMLMFNLGVEIGQLIFVAAIAALTLLLARWKPRVPLPPRSLVPYAIGSLSAFWFVERFSTLLSSSV